MVALFGEEWPKMPKYTRELKALKPKRTRVRIVRVKDLERRHGKHTRGMAWHRKGFHTVAITPQLTRHEIAHEFGHIALKHNPSLKRESNGEYLRKELEADQWATDNWQKPNRWILPRKYWIDTVVGQGMCDLNLSYDTTLKIVKHQMKILGMKPLLPSEEKFIKTRARQFEKKLIAEGWKPKDG